jgi:hypothetical protein
VSKSTGLSRKDRDVIVAKKNFLKNPLISNLSETFYTKTGIQLTCSQECINYIKTLCCRMH